MYFIQKLLNFTDFFTKYYYNKPPENRIIILNNFQIIKNFFTLNFLNIKILNNIQNIEFKFSIIFIFEQYL